MDLASQVATRFIKAGIEASEVLVTPEYLAALVKRLDPAEVYEAARRLEKLQKDLEYERITPFPVAEIEDYLRDWGVDEAEIQHVKSVKVQAPRPRRPRKTMSFIDAYLALEKELGVSVIYEGRLVHEPGTVEVIGAWIKGFRKVKPKAKTIFQRLVKKVKLAHPRGSEDASWQPGGVMVLAVRASPPPPTSAAYFITHELGHAVEEAHHVDLWKHPWGSPPFVSDYAEMRPNVEDFAESFVTFIVQPSELRRLSQAKYDAMRAIV